MFYTHIHIVCCLVNMSVCNSSSMFIWDQIFLAWHSHVVKERKNLSLLLHWQHLQQCWHIYQHLKNACIIHYILNVYLPLKMSSRGGRTLIVFNHFMLWTKSVVFLNCQNLFISFYWCWHVLCVCLSQSMTSNLLFASTLAGDFQQDGVTAERMKGTGSVY